MTNPGNSGTPHPAQPPGRHSPAHSGTPVWWVVAGLAVLVSVALLVWLVVGGDPAPAPTVPVSATPAPSTSTSAVPSDPVTTASSPMASLDPSPSDVTEKWGEFPPTNVDSLKDLSTAEFPKTVGSYAFNDENRTEYLVIASYRETGGTRTMGSSLELVGGSYKNLVQGLEEVAYYGRAVCGMSTAGALVQPSCVMAGSSQVLEVGTASEETTMEEIAAFTEELYDSL